MLKRTFLIATSIMISLALFLTITSCAPHGTSNSFQNDVILNYESLSGSGDGLITQRSEIELTFTEAVELSDCAVVAEFELYSKAGDGVEYTFKVKEVLRGSIKEKTIHLFDSVGTSYIEGTDYSYNTGEDIYRVGEAYLLIMEEDDSLFFEYPHYVLVTNIYAPVNDFGKSTMYDKNLSELSGIKSLDETKTYIRKAKAKVKVDGEHYTTATDYPTIVKESDLVLEVKIVDLSSEGIYGNRNTYVTEVRKIIKGDRLSTYDSGEIALVLMKGSVEIGKEYLVIINRIDDTSRIYTQSSKKSVIPLSDKKTIEEIQKQVSKK